MQIEDTLAFLTPEEMAAKLRISLRTLHKMMRKGAPEHIRLGGRVLFVMQGGSSHD